MFYMLMYVAREPSVPKWDRYGKPILQIYPIQSLTREFIHFESWG